MQMMESTQVVPFQRVCRGLRQQSAAGTAGMVVGMVTGAPRPNLTVLET